MIHTQETITRAAQLWNGGLSASRVGAEMGLSRNSIIGIVNRNKGVFEKRGTTKRAAYIRKNWTPEKKAESIRHEQRRNVSTVKLFPTLTKTPIPQAIRTAYDAERREVAVTLDALQTGQCKWALTDGKPFYFCAAATDENYCSHHAARAFQLKDRRT